MPRRVAVLLLLCLLPLPSAVGAHALAAGVDGPDPDGAYSLSFDIHRDEAGSVALALDVVRTDADGTLAGTRDLGSMDLPVGFSTRAFSFLPAEGAGQYVVGLLVNGERLAESSFDVADASSSASLTFAVADAATYLNLTNDTVNADGKVKAPGEALLTRAVISDANGLVDVDALVWNVERANATLADGVILAPSNATSWSFEHRFDASPFESGNYTLRLRALKAAAPVASAARTFVIREVAPTLVSGSLSNVTPDAGATQTGAIVLADRNGLPAGILEARVYRGSARVEGAGFAASLGAPTRTVDAEGAARFAYPLMLHVPAVAANGTYRVSIYHDGSLVGAVPFEVLPLPALLAVSTNATGDRLALHARGAGSGIVIARLADGNGTATLQSAPFIDGNATLTLTAPRRGVALRWNLTLHAREGGPVLDAREGNWTPAATGPNLTLTPLGVGSRLPAAWRIGSDWSLEGGNAMVSFTRWDGQPEPSLTASLDGDRLRVSAPTNLPTGRYTARVVVALPNGSAGEATWSFDAGPWVELALGAPNVTGNVGTVALRNTGGLAISRIVVEAEPRADLALLRGAQTILPATSGSRSVFAATLAPGEEATLRVQLPEGPRRSGAHEVELRVLARVDLG